MLAVTLGQILKHVEQFEQLLSDFYAKLSHETTHEGVRLLTEYMSRHSSHIYALLDKLPTEKRKTLCSTPIPYEPHLPGKHCIDLAKLPADPTADQVLDAAVGFDECLVKMYHSTAEQPISQEMKDFFETLIRDVEIDEILLKKIKAMNYF